MNIKVPMFVVRANNRFIEWGNAHLWSRFDLRRLDALVGVGFIFCVAWYGAQYGWQGALQGGAAFIALAALALFVRRS